MGNGLRKVRRATWRESLYPGAFTSIEGGGSGLQNVVGCGEMERGVPWSGAEQSSGVRMGA